MFYEKFFDLLKVFGSACFNRPTELGVCSRLKNILLFFVWTRCMLCVGHTTPTQKLFYLHVFHQVDF